MVLKYAVTITATVMLLINGVSASTNTSTQGVGLTVIELANKPSKRQVRQFKKQISKLEVALQKQQKLESKLQAEEEVLKKKAWALAGKRKERGKTKIKRTEQKTLDKLTAKRAELAPVQAEINNIQFQIKNIERQIAGEEGVIQVAEIPKKENKTERNSKTDKLLDEAVNGWIGTPYRYGGQSKSGVDCSGFVGNVYRSVYKKDLPRVSADMQRESKRVSKSSLKKGDLVFFKMKRASVDHVGIYMGKGKFAHASSSRGVIITDLNDSYYKVRYHSSGRF